MPAPKVTQLRLKIAAYAAFILIAAIVLLQNTTVVTVRFLFWELSMSRSLLLFMTFLLGAAAGVVGTFAWRAWRR